VEDFFDLILPIKNFEGMKFTSIHESIAFLMNPEMMDGPNQYACELCGGKRDALKGQRFEHLPDVLTLSLMRFDFNYQTFERVKINDFYKFDLRLDLSRYTGRADEVYDLVAVIVHRGDAYAGHYHAIIRDALLEADVTEIDNQKLLVGLPVYPLDPLANQRSWVEHARDLPTSTEELFRSLFRQPAGEEAKEPGEPAAKPDQKKDKRDKKSKKDDKPPKQEKQEEPDDPFPTEVPRTPETEYLFNNWWNLDDSRVSRIDVNRLSKYFGKNKESAYILMYRKVALNANNEQIRDAVPPAPVFEDIQQEERSMQTFVDSYDIMKTKLRIKVRHVDHAYDHDCQAIKEGQSRTVELDFEETLASLKQKVRGQLDLAPDARFLLVQYDPVANGTVQMPSMITDGDPWQERFLLVKDLMLYHNTDYLVVPVDHPLVPELQDLLSLGNVRVRVKVRTGEKVTEMLIRKYANNQQLLELFRPLVQDWQLRLQDIFVVDVDEKRALAEIPKTQRVKGIPSDDFEFCLLNTDNIYKQGGLQLVANSDYTFAETALKVSLLISRDDTDSDSATKFLADKNLTLDGLLKLLKEYYELEPASMRRLRDLYHGKLIKKNEMSLTLEEYRRKEGVDPGCLGERLRLERGQQPQAEGVLLKIRLDIPTETGEKITLRDELAVTLYDHVREVLEAVCSKLNVDADEYYLYTVNWAEDAVKKLADMTLTVEEAGIIEDCSLRLMHCTHGMSDEMRTYEVHFSESGHPGDLRKLGKVSINENLKVSDLKANIKQLCTKETGFETAFTLENMVVRQLNKLNKPSKVLSEASKTIKRLKVNCIGLVFTIYEPPILCKPTELRIFVRRRINREAYQNYQELALDK